MQENNYTTGTLIKEQQRSYFAEVIIPLALPKIIHGQYRRSLWEKYNQDHGLKYN
jgi:hypothetical protein